jgi:hypothetical protein
MLKALKKLGRVTLVGTKTTCVLAPKEGVSWQQIRHALQTNLHPSKGNVFYVNLRTGSAFQLSKRTGYEWKSVI